MSSRDTLRAPLLQADILADLDEVDKNINRVADESRERKKKKSLLRKCADLVASFDWDLLLAYRTVKVVKIRDKYLGVCHMLIVLASIAWIVYQILITRDGVFKHDRAIGSMKLVLSRPSNMSSEAPYCPNCNIYDGSEPDCPCLFWDANDLMYPTEQEDSIFIATRVQFTIQQERIDNACDGPNNPCKAPWSEGKKPDAYLLLNVDQYVLDVYHWGTAPAFYLQDVQNGNFESNWLRSSTKNWGQLIDQSGNSILDFQPDVHDAIPIGLLLQAAGLDYVRDNIGLQGAYLQVLVEYGDCNSLINEADERSTKLCKTSLIPNMNYYQYRVHYVPADLICQLSRTFYNVDSTERTLKNTTGLRVAFDVLGDQRLFSFPVLLATMVSRYIILTLSTLAVDFILLRLLPGRNLYANAKYEKSDNVVDLRRNIVKEQSLKEKIKKLKKLAMFKQIKQIDKLLATLKNTVIDSEYDQLLLALINVYVIEHNDELTSLLFFQRLRLEENKVKANLMLGRLKEAYLIAVKIGDVALVQQVHDAAQQLNYSRLVELCEQYMSASV